MKKSLKIISLVLVFSALSILIPNGSPEALAQPAYTEVELLSLAGEIYVNPEFIGKVRSIRTIDRTGLLGDRIEVEVRIMTDDWRKFTLPPELSGAFGIIISGEQGILKISLPEAAPSSNGKAVYSIHKLLIEFGSLNSTFIYPSQSVIEPSKYSVGLLNNTDQSAITGKVVAMKADELAAKFENLPSTVVNTDGNIRLSISKPDGGSIDTELPAWGYNISVPETDIDKEAPITAEVFGLNPEDKIRFDFSSLGGQVIAPSTQILTVKEINSGATIATITTSRGGPQPLTVTVKKVQ